MTIAAAILLGCFIHLPTHKLLKQLRDHMAECLLALSFGTRLRAAITGLLTFVHSSVLLRPENQQARTQ